MLYRQTRQLPLQAQGNLCVCFQSLPYIVSGVNLRDSPRKTGALCQVLDQFQEETMTSSQQMAEIKLRKALEENYQQARIRAEFFEAIAQIHGPLEKALDARLGLTEEEAKDRAWSFSKKAYESLPELSSRFNISKVNGQRNDLIHNLRDFTDHEVKGIADDFAQFALAAWPELFGSRSRRPTIQTPYLSSQLLHQPIPKPASSSTPVTPAPSTKTKVHSGPTLGQDRKILWRSLIVGGLLLLPIPWLAGFTGALWRKTALNWYWLLLLNCFVLFLFLLGFSYLWRFFRTVGFKRTVAGLSVLTVLLTLALIPFTEPRSPEGSKAGAAVDRLLTSLNRATLGATRRAFSHGQSAAGVLFAQPETEPVLGVQSRTTVTPAAALATTAVTATETAETVEPALTATSRPSPTPSVPLAVGMRVVVSTGGGRLNLRVEPGTNADIVTPLENGTELTIIGGPQAAGGFTWWEVEGAAGRGWTAGQYLSPILP